MPMVMALTPNTAEAMRAQVIHLSPTVVASMRTAEGGTKMQGCPVAPQNVCSPSRMS